MRYIAYALCKFTKRICDISHMRYVNLQNAYAIYRICDMQFIRTRMHSFKLDHVHVPFSYPMCNLTC